MVLLTQYNGSILGPIAKVLGWIFNGIFELTANFGILNIGLTIILFTVIIKLIMLPLTIKQMKFSKMSSIMNPELTALQKKYKGKTDQDSMLKMQEEQKAIYEKYGTSPTGGCLQLIIQMPILFALYRVMQNIPAYVGSVKNIFINMLSGSNGLMAQNNFVTIMTDNFGTLHGDYSTIDKTIDAMNYFSTAQWEQLEELFPSCAAVISENVDKLFGMYNFFGINLSVNPELLSVSVLIPILTALTQWISMKTVSGKNTANMEDNPAMKSMQTMNTIMPIMTGFIALSLPSALGLYWIATAVCQTVQQLLLNIYFNKIDIDEFVKKNVEKANDKRKKKGLPPNTISTKANTNTKNIQQNFVNSLEETRRKNMEKVEEIKKSTEYYNNSGDKKNSLAAKANMVAKYNEKNNKK